MKNNNFFASFKYACEGIIHASKGERNFSRVSLYEWVILIGCIAGMLSLELINSAIERVVDLASPEIHDFAKQAKDMGAAAVLVFACASAIIGILIFLPKWMEIFN